MKSIRIFVSVMFLSLALFNIQCSDRKQAATAQADSQATEQTTPVPDAQDETSNVSAAEIQFDELSTDIGEISRSENPLRTHVFEFTNIGQDPLVIHSADGFCECTVVEFSTDSVMPGQRGKITATYDAKIGNLGVFHKTIEVRYNGSKDPVILTLSGLCKQ